ncbi:MAG: OFA family MFS transporter [Sulfolobales archaeon]|nr:OFA family MFS transporter [Sulfolobales archaeon]MCX8185888.1 OFA family MFS transporter [Sulfolobales archaeon]MDW7969145.1 OFA family MFS transporter [Sulfolobales archaeon]
MNKWIILMCSTTVMMVISIYQYSWSLYAYAISDELRWSITTISLAFTIFVYASTFIQPFSGFLADKYGSRKLALISSTLVGLGFLLSSYVSSPTELYLTYGLGSIGVGTLYGIATATAVKWFPERKGLATGIVTFGFGAGASLFNLPIQGLISAGGFRMAFTYVGLFMLVALAPFSYLLIYPKGGTQRKLGNKQVTDVNYTPFEMLRTKQWYLIYLTFIITPAAALMFGAQIKLMASEFNIPTSYLNIVLVTFPLANGLSRIIAGIISDRIGRELTMTSFYLLLGTSLLGLSYLGGSPSMFLLFTLAASLLGGAPYTFYPSIIGDYYGVRYSTVNYGITYTAKAWAGLISGWITAYLVETYGSYTLPLTTIALLCIVAALLSSPIILKPPKRHVSDRALR